MGGMWGAPAGKSRAPTRSALPPVPPHESVARGVVPHDADQAAGKTRQSPAAAVPVIEHVGDVDVGDGADAAQSREHDKSADDAEAAIAAVVVGDLVVEHEIAR